LDYNKAYQDNLLEEEEKLNKLSKEILQMKEKQELFVNDYYDTHENKIKNEIELLKQTIDEDNARIDIKKKIDDASNDRRIIQIGELEKQVCHLVDRSEKMRELEIRKIDEEYEARKTREDANLQVKLKDESLANLEFRTMIKLENVLSNKKIEEQNRKQRLESL
jgi:hypothetical protein